MRHLQAQASRTTKPDTRWLFILFILCTICQTGFAAQRRQTPVSRQKKADAARQLQLAQIEKWFDRLASVCEEYYGEVAAHQRVKSFTAWALQNRKSLVEDYQRDLAGKHLPLVSQQKIVPLFAFWLGVRYDAHHYRLVPQQRFPPIRVISAASRYQVDVARYNEQAARFELSGSFLQSLLTQQKPEMFVFIQGFNLGLHEGGHALNYINAREGMLSEVGVAGVHTRLALPLKSQDVKESDLFRFGLREFNLAVRHFAAGMKAGDTSLAPDYLESEYLGYVFGPWLNNPAHASDPLRYLIDPNATDSEFTLQSLLYNAEQSRKLLENLDLDFDYDEAPISLEWMVDQFCAEGGIKDAQLKVKITKAFAWAHGCIGGTACGGEFKGLYQELEHARKYALKMEQSKSRRAQTVPAKVVQARVLFMKFLVALQAKLTEIFGPPLMFPLPEGFVKNGPAATTAPAEHTA